MRIQLIVLVILAIGNSGLSRATTPERHPFFGELNRNFWCYYFSTPTAEFERFKKTPGVSDVWSGPTGIYFMATDEAVQSLNNQVCQRTDIKYFRSIETVNEIPKQQTLDSAYACVLDCSRSGQHRFTQIDSSVGASFEDSRSKALALYPDPFAACGGTHGTDDTGPNKLQAGITCCQQWSEDSPAYLNCR